MPIEKILLVKRINDRYEALRVKTNSAVTWEGNLMIIAAFVCFWQAQSDVERAREDASIGSKHLEEQMVSFEKRRLHDIKVGIF